MSYRKSILEFLLKLIKTGRSYVTGYFDMGDPGDGGGLINDFSGGDIEEDGGSASKLNQLNPQPEPPGINQGGDGPAGGLNWNWLGIGCLGLLILIVAVLILGFFFDIFTGITVDNTPTPTVFFDVFNPIEFASSTPTPPLYSLMFFHPLSRFHQPPRHAQLQHRRVVPKSPRFARMPEAR